MNYDFDYKQIGMVSTDLVERLIAFSQQFQYTQSRGWPILGSGPIDLARPEVVSVLESLRPIADPALCLRVHFNTLPPMSYVYEHSDTEHSKYCTVTHRVHIPLTTNDRCAFMWGGRDRDRMPSLGQMQVGGVYIMNEIVKHSLINLSDQPRTHFVAMYKASAINVNVCPIPDASDPQ